MKPHRRKLAAAFKAMVALEALKGMETGNQAAAKLEVHPGQVSQWKGCRPSRLGKQYRLMDKVEGKKLYVQVIDISPHGYRIK